MSDLIAYIDGGSHGNPGPSGVGILIDGAMAGPIRIAKWIGHQDNNVAEYVALLEALQCALTLRATRLHVYSDSDVVVKQMAGEYTCRSSRLYSLNWTCRKLARSLDFSISRVGRQRNAEANRLANLAARCPLICGLPHTNGECVAHEFSDSMISRICAFSPVPFVLTGGVSNTVPHRTTGCQSLPGSR
jgi:ribonuclease HI